MFSWCFKLDHRHFLPWLLRLSLAALLVAPLGGCGREEIRVYTVPKEQPTRSTAHASAAHPRPELSWKLPPHWRETSPSQMSLASFAIDGPGGQEAQVTVTALPMLSGREALIVNMWREQVGLAPLAEEQVEKQLQSVEVGGERGKLFEVAGEGKEGSAPMRIVTAMVHRNDASWFYKLAGDAALVETQKPAFIEFLKSFQITEAAVSPVASSSDSPKPNWQVPPQWKQLPAGQMQIARFAVPERSGAKAEVFVSVFGEDTGGTLANVNRWRKDLGLADLDEAGLAQVVSALDSANPEAKLVDMMNKDKRVVAAIVPRDGSYWFYKLHGDADAVAPEKEAFVAFTKSKP